MRTTARLSSILLLTLPHLTLAQTDERELIRQVDEVFAEYDSTASPGCALSVIRDGEVIYTRGYGMANLDHDLAITPSTVFRIGSTSKQFAAASIALLAREGKLSLDDDVRKLVPELPENDPPVTIRHLIHHTSGLRDYLTLMTLAGKRDEDYYTDEDVLEMLSRQKALNFPPGEEHLYSNTGYFLLSVIVERASGKSLREYAEEKIFRPLGMRHTHFHDDHRHIVKNRADGYSRTEDGGFEISKTTLEMVGDGGVFTSVEDLYLWDRNFYDNRLGPGGPELIGELLTPGVLNNGEKLTYAFGLGVTEYKGLRKVAHGGAFVGYRAEMIRFPDEKLSVACLCNLAQTNPGRLAQQVADLYLADKLAEPGAPDGQEVTAEAKVEVAPETLATLAGRYFDADRGMLRRIEVREGKLFYVRPPDNDSELEPLGENRFRMLGVPVKIEVFFEPPREGAEPDMVVTVDDGSPDRFQRIDGAPPTADELAAFAGRFYSEELDTTWELELRGDGLAVTGIGGREIELVPALRDTFAGRVTLEFSRDSEGDVRGFSVAAGRVRGIGFRRVSSAE